MKALAPGLMAATVLLTPGCGQAGGEGKSAEARVAELEQALQRRKDRIGALEARLEDARARADSPDGEQPAPLRSEQGLVDQLRTYVGPLPTLEGRPLEVTDWQPADVPEGFAEAAASGYETPGELVTALAAERTGPQLGRDVWEVTARVLPGDDDGDGAGTATAAVLEWGLADDAVAGSDLRLQLVEGDAGWYAEAAEQRHYCRRGVGDEGLCL